MTNVMFNNECYVSVCYYLFSQVKKVWRELSEAVYLGREGTAQLSDVLSQVMVAQRCSVHCSQTDQLYDT